MLRCKLGTIGGNRSSSSTAMRANPISPQDAASLVQVSAEQQRQEQQESVIDYSRWDGVCTSESDVDKQDDDDDDDDDEDDCDDDGGYYWQSEARDGEN